MKHKIQKVELFVGVIVLLGGLLTYGLGVHQLLPVPRPDLVVYGTTLIGIILILMGCDIFSKPTKEMQILENDERNIAITNASLANAYKVTLQSLSDSTKYKYRYLTLRRLGINDKSLFKTIRKQLLILFCVPAISAILCSFVMMSSLNNVYQQILGDKHLYLMYFGLNLIIFFLIYSIYWIATYIGFKRNINEES